jgi:hypothetical protein
MRAITITAPPYEFTDVLDVRMRKRAGRHGSAWVRGVVSDEAG